MVGSAQYLDCEIEFILQLVVQKKKNAEIQSLYEARFGKGLNNNQVRYIKNKYGKDPRFNSPLVNARAGITNPVRTNSVSTQAGHAGAAFDTHVSSATVMSQMRRDAYNQRQMQQHGRLTNIDAPPRSSMATPQMADWRVAPPSRPGGANSTNISVNPNATRNIAEWVNKSSDHVDANHLQSPLLNSSIPPCPQTPLQSRSKPTMERESRGRNGDGHVHRRGSSGSTVVARGAVSRFDANRMTPSHENENWQPGPGQEYGMNLLNPSFTETSDPVVLPQQQPIFPTSGFPNEQYGGGAAAFSPFFAPISTAESFLTSDATRSPAPPMYSYASPIHATYSTPSPLNSRLPLRVSSSSILPDTLAVCPDLHGHWEENTWAAYAQANPLPEWSTVSGSPELYSAPETETVAVITPISLQDVTETGITSHNASAISDLLRCMDEAQLEKIKQSRDQQQGDSSRVDHAVTPCATLRSTTAVTEQSFTDVMRDLCHFTPDSSDHHSLAQLSTTSSSSPKASEPQLADTVSASADASPSDGRPSRQEDSHHDHLLAVQGTSGDNRAS